MKTHTVIGERLCGDVRFLRNVRPIVRHHHERLDGSGYPDGLRGDAIPLLAQIMGVVDVFDAVTTDRPYRTAMPFSHAAEELRAEATRGWRDLQLVDRFLELIDVERISYGAGTVHLDSGGRRRTGHPDTRSELLQG